MKTKNIIFCSVIAILVIVGLYLGTSTGFKASLLGNQIPVIDSVSTDCDSIHIIYHDPDIIHAEMNKIKVFVNSIKTENLLGKYDGSDITITAENANNFPENAELYKLFLIPLDTYNGDIIVWYGQTSADKDYRFMWDRKECGTIAVNEDENVDDEQPELTLLYNKNLFIDEYAGMCGIPGTEDDKDHLFNNITFGTDGETLFLNGYYDSMMIALKEDNHMEIEADKTLNFIGEKTFMLNDGYPPGSFKLNDETADCGTPRFWPGMGIGADFYYLYQLNHVSGVYGLLMKKIGNDYAVFAEFGTCGTKAVNTDDGFYCPRERGGYVMGPNYPYMYYDHVLVHENGKVYGLTKSYDNQYIDDLTDQKFGIFDITNPKNQKHITDLTFGGSLLGAKYPNRSLRSKAGNAGASGAGNLPMILSGTDGVYEIDIVDDEYKETLLAAIPVRDDTVMRIDNTLYFAADEGLVGEGSFYKYEIGVDTEPHEIDIDLTKFNFLENNYKFEKAVRYTDDHKLISLHSIDPNNGYMPSNKNIYIFDLKTEKMIYEGPIPEGYAPEGVRHRSESWRNFAAAHHVENGIDYYDIYLIRSRPLEAFPATVQAFRIGPSTDGELIDETCTPDCSNPKACGQPDGCGGYCGESTTMTPSALVDQPSPDAGYYDGCGDPNGLLGCHPIVYEDMGQAMYQIPSCQCAIPADQNAQCKPGQETKCTYTGPFGSKKCGDTTWHVQEYECVGPSNACSFFNLVGGVKQVCNEPLECDKE